MLGLGSGILLERVLSEVPEVTVFGVDHFVRKDKRDKVMAIRKAHEDRCNICVAKTSQAVSLVADGEFDFVFLDASRKYGCVRADIRSWWPKLKVGGWFGGRAYAEENPGVVTAVTERFGDAVGSLGYSVWATTKTGDET